MSEELCPTCGAESAGASQQTTPLDIHINDYNDPHHTLEKVPATYYGNVPPSTTVGYKAGDWYVDITSKVVYSCSVQNGQSGQTLSWVQASTQTAVTQQMLTAALQAYVTSASLTTTLASYLPRSEATSFVTDQQLLSRGYATQQYVTSALSSYVTSAALSQLGYLDAAGVASILSSYVTSSALTTALSSYYTKTQADARYATAAQIASFVTASDVQSAIAAGCVRRQPSTAGTYPELDLDVILQSYLTTASASSTYLTKTLAASTYVTPTQLTQTLSAYSTPASVDTTLAAYLSKTEAQLAYLSLSAASQTYVAKTDVSQYLTNYVTTSALSTALSPYVTLAAANARYALASAVTDLVSESDLSTVLTSYASKSYLSGQLASYLTMSAAAATYATPAYIATLGFLTETSSFFNTFVRRNSGETNIDTILAAWPVSSVTAGESRPPKSSAVHTFVGALETRHNALEATVQSLVITGGNSNVMKDITEYVQHAVDGAQVEHLKLYDNATNWISASASATLLGTSNINLSFPARTANGVARDFLFCITFDGSSTEQVSNAVVSVKNRDGTTPVLSSYVSNPFSLSGVVYGSTVIWAFTEYTDGKYAVTRKIVYPVGGFTGA